MPRIRARTKKGEDAKEYNLAECPKLTLVISTFGYTFAVYKNGALISTRTCEWLESLRAVEDAFAIANIPCRVMRLPEEFCEQADGELHDLYPTVDSLDRALAAWDRDNVQIPIQEE